MFISLVMVAGSAVYATLVAHQRWIGIVVIGFLVGILLAEHDWSRGGRR